MPRESSSSRGHHSDSREVYPSASSVQAAPWSSGDLELRMFVKVSCKILRFRIFHFWYSDVTVEEKGNHIIPFLNLSNLTETTDGRAGGCGGGGSAGIPSVSECSSNARSVLDGSSFLGLSRDGTGRSVQATYETV